MYQEFFAKSDHLIWPLLGLVIFVLIFIGVLAYVFLGLRDRDKIDAVAVCFAWAFGLRIDPKNLPG